MQKSLIVFMAIAMIIAGWGFSPVNAGERDIMMYDADVEGNITNARSIGRAVISQGGDLRTPPPAEPQVVVDEVNYGALSHNPFTTAFAPQIQRNPGMTLQGTTHEDVLFIFEDGEAIPDAPGAAAVNISRATWFGDYGFWDVQPVSTSQDPEPTGLRRKSMAFTSDGIAHIVYGYTTNPGNPADRASLQLMHATYDILMGDLQFQGNVNPGNQRGISYPVIRANSEDRLFLATMDYDTDGKYHTAYTDENGDWVWNEGDNYTVEDPNGIYGWGVINSAIDPVTNDFYIFWPTDFNGDQCADLAVKKMDYQTGQWDPAPIDEGHVLAMGNAGLAGSTLIPPQGSEQQQYDFLCWPHVVIDNSGYIHVVFTGNMVDWPPNPGEEGQLSFWNVMGLAGVLYYTRSENPRDPTSWLDPQPLLDRDPDGWYNNLASVGGMSIDETGSLYFVYHQADSIWADPAAPVGWNWQLPVEVKMIHWIRDFDWWDTENPDVLYRASADEDHSYHNTVVGPMVIGPSHTDDESAWGLDVAIAESDAIQDPLIPLRLHYLRTAYYPTESGIFSGTVVDGGGNPMGGVLVRAQNDEREFTSVTEADGSYECLVTPGTYTLSAYLFGYSEDVAGEYTIANEEEIQVDFTITILATGHLDGTVSDAYDGYLVEGATLRLLDTPVPEVTSDANGYYIFNDVPEGTYMLHADDINHAPREMEVTITGGQTTTADVSLIPAYSFEEDDGGWAQSGGGQSNWEWGEPTYGSGPATAYHGTNCWGTRVTSYYRGPSNRYLNTPVYTLSGDDPAAMEVYLWINTELGDDGVNVQMSVDGGSWDVIEPSFTPVQPEGGYDEDNVTGLGGPGWSGNYGGWFLAQFDLAEHQGHDVQFRFRFGAATSNSDRLAGVYVDYVIVYGQGEGGGGDEYMISGNVGYCQDTTSPIANAEIALSGDHSATVMTDADGNYQFNNIPGGNITSTPAKEGDVNGISTFDAARVAQYSAGLYDLTECQIWAGDVTQNGNTNTFDAARIAQYSAGIEHNSHAGEWVFNPVEYTYMPLNGDQMDQDFAGILLGEVTGNWSPAVANVISKSGSANQVQATTVQYDGALLQAPMMEDILAFQFILESDADISAALTSNVPSDWELIVAQREDNTWFVGAYGLTALDSPELVVIEGAAEVVSGLVNETPITVEKVANGTSVPKAYGLLQNSPNPFNPRTTITYRLPVTSDVSISVYDVAGRLVHSWNYDAQSAGQYDVVWDGTDMMGQSVSSGVYLYRLEANDFSQTRQMILLK